MSGSEIVPPSMLSYFLPWPLHIKKATAANPAAITPIIMYNTIKISINTALPYVADVPLSR